MLTNKEEGQNSLRALICLWSARGFVGSSSAVNATETGCAASFLLAETSGPSSGHSCTPVYARKVPSTVFFLLRTPFLLADFFCYYLQRHNKFGMPLVFKASLVLFAKLELATAHSDTKVVNGLWRPGSDMWVFL